MGISDTTYWCIAIFIAALLFIISFWQKKMWIFIVDAVVWIGLAIFGFTNSSAYTVGWLCAWIYLMLGVVCTTSTLWLHEKRDAPLESPQDQGWNEMKERMRERKNKRGDV
jgi:hypothetical protein